MNERPMGGRNESETYATLTRMLPLVDPLTCFPVRSLITAIFGCGLPLGMMREGVPRKPRVVNRRRAASEGRCPPPGG